ncbi:MAG: hypothetical protein COX46_01785 [bacterium (Candidatus Ratteibacteria) CG23_combo_of_CG06-09_8_20_14_all_48_7]|uniref:Uroporphyrinogen decarboxylase (URO-D) domain-containing protein n=1 Tax=bacterium (Candidatus Ratteibacteria) CG23_combo_of_CG06-09_8_20_14_all_48_7 TaxID=2014292 RepID=A0A2G9YBB6_9BACT|nr:MAG: hypothetical protein COX46_01785 [bacterium (Candidatus Ratteibacteria) CG23_combo_of_CG06-09_8_20_14_all_48_7]
MTNREGFIEALLFGKPDKVPFMPGGPRESTLVRWYEEGLPKSRDWYEVLLERLGLPEEPSRERISLEIDFRMSPQFEEKVLEHKDGHYIVQDWMGAITEISDKYDYTYIRSSKDFVTRKWHKFPVENRRDWEEMKRRFDPKTQGRYPVDLSERCAKLQDRDHVLTIAFNGPFWQLREWCGFENLCLFMAENPDFVMEMTRFWQNFVLAVLEPVLSRVAPDHILISEDMAYKVKSMISPAMVRKFLMPVWQAWTARIRKSGCPVIEVDSDGYIEELIPLWIESGINVCSPIEVAAGNDLLAYRKRFGKNMAYRGGIDKRAIAKGGKVLEDEVMRVAPSLLKDGGYIPSCDHGVPPDISWQNFIEYSRLLARLTGWR